jgi:cytochrome c peroxidase
VGGLEFGAGNRGTIPARASVQHECFADEQACAAVSGSYPGSVRTRFSNRKRTPTRRSRRCCTGQGDLVGGNFWDTRAPGRQLGKPAAEQAQRPPTNPVEMDLPDIACAVYALHITSLKAIVHFYNTRDVLPCCQPHCVLLRSSASWA